MSWFRPLARTSIWFVSVTAKGDVFAYRRPVDFVFVTESERQAAVVAGFMRCIEALFTITRPLSQLSPTNWVISCGALKVR